MYCTCTFFIRKWNVNLQEEKKVSHTEMNKNPSDAFHSQTLQFFFSLLPKDMDFY